MQYYERLGLSREPFSNSPDPEFLYYSGQHIACLQELEIAVRLRRGLNVVIGAVGTGKTTLIRRFIKNMNTDDSMRLHLVLDPYFKSPHAFLRMLCAQVLGTMPDRRLNTFALKELLKKELYRRGVERDLASVLIVDEGQKMTAECLEVLRELLNYETNSKKLLQILLFGQTELAPILKRVENLQDRINSYITLRPLKFKETRAMIEYRLAISAPTGEQAPNLFTQPAYYAIHRASRGYPRKTMRLCHKLLLNLLIRKKKRANMGLVRTVVQEELPTGFRSGASACGLAVVGLLLVAGLLAVRYVPQVRSMVRGVESAVASTFTTREQERSPFAPVVPSLATGAKGVTEEAQTLQADVDEPVTLDEYLAKKPQVGELEKSAQVLARNGGQMEAAPIASVEAAEPVEQTVPGHVTPAVLDAGELLAADKPATSGALYALPDKLGQLPVMPQESLSVIIRKVYGVYDKANLRKVLAANPGLKNGDAIAVGQPLNFPVIKPGSRGLALSLSWVRLSVERRLDKAYGRLRAATLFGFDSRLLPYVAADGGLAFAVVLERPFASAEEAEIERGCLPLALQKQSGVMFTPAPDVSLGQMNDLAMRVLQAKFTQ